MSSIGRALILSHSLAAILFGVRALSVRVYRFGVFITATRCCGIYYMKMQNISLSFIRMTLSTSCKGSALVVSLRPGVSSETTFRSCQQTRPYSRGILNRCPQILSRTQLPSECLHNCSNSVLFSRILSPTASPVQQRRNVSQSFYSEYLSPDFPPIGFAQNVLETIHTSVGLPWWATIALATFALRTATTLPLMIYSLHNVAKVEKLQPEIKALAEELGAEVRHAQLQKKWNSRMAKYHFKWNMKRLVKDLYIRDNCHPFKEYIIPWVQIPLWISVSLALRNMAGALPVQGMDLPVLCPDFATGGALWFSNLLLPDSTFLLPFIMCFSNLIILEMHHLKVLKPTRFQNAVTYAFRGLMIIIFPIASSVPSCMCLYWTCSSLYGLCQNVLLKLPRVRRFFRIPKTPSESQTPFQDIMTIAREKYTFKKRQPRNNNVGDKS